MRKENKTRGTTMMRMKPMRLKMGSNKMVGKMVNYMNHKKLQSTLVMESQLKTLSQNNNLKSPLNKNKNNNKKIKKANTFDRFFAFVHLSVLTVQ